MSTKLALILTGVWTLLVVAACSGALWFVTSKVPRSQQDERARLFGGSIGILAAIGYAGVWLPWAVAYRKRHQQQQAPRDADEDDERPRRRRKR